MKKLISLVLIFALVLSLAACTKTEPAPTPTETAPVETVPAETEPAEPEAFPVTLTDQAGREVTIPAEPMRIVCSYYISTSAVIALGLQDRMVGIEAKAEKRTLYRLCAPELTELPSVGTAKEFDLEGCAALKPDLVILPLKLKSVVESLEALEIPVLLVNPESGELMRSMVELIARAAGVTDRAREITDFLDEKTDLLNTIGGEAPTVYLGGNSSFLSTSGANMYQSSMIELAGGINAAREITDTYWAEISYEQLLSWDPDYIVLASDAAYTVEDVLSDSNLAACRAVVNRNVYHIPGDIEAWDSPVPGSILGALWLASILHPEDVTAEDVSSAISDFYETFYGFIPA